MLTLEELKERMSMEDEVTLLETLNISAEDLVNAFSDKIEDKYDKLIKEYDE